MTNYYPEMSNFDLREEFEQMIMGSFEAPGIGRPVVYRKLSDINCKCWDGLTGSPDPNCIYCGGEGFEFTETLILTYIAKNFGSVLGGATQLGQQSQLATPGYFESDKAIAYLSYYNIPDYERYTAPHRKAPDKIYELKVDDFGNLVVPNIRMDKWIIRSLTPHHGDHGRVEFIELGLEKVTT